MSGEFERRIRKTALGEIEALLDVSEVLEVVEEAKKERPQLNVREFVENGVSPLAALEIINTKKDEWFVRWFGEADA